ncbi:hypothetical protein BKA59DRAFT_532859 [Fusarium tricinctum]|uniref:Uncharacterized protein n=1 Tax=Fusarium tricinctum TaxID=61284 RepID=A0A8K0W755_9HYPO|nr:hypothetical protein BKA59DRAFT_532859 [Fusarium tricinctum]
MRTFPIAWTPALFLPTPSSVYQAKPHRTPQPTADIMVTTSPFEKLPLELTTMIFNDFESPRDIEAVICADSCMLHHFVANRLHLVRRFQDILKDGFIGTNISIALKACRLRHVERTFRDLDRVQISRRVESALKSPQDLREGRRPVWQLSLETISQLLELLSESDMFVDDYALEVWDYFQGVADIDGNHEISWISHDPTPRVPLLLPRSEDFRIQSAYLLFDAFRHTLWFDISLLRNTQVNQVSVFNNSKARWEDSDWGTRAFQAVYRFIFQRYKRLMYRACSTQQFRSGLQRDVYENFHWVAHLSSQRHSIHLCLLGNDEACLKQYMSLVRQSRYDTGLSIRSAIVGNGLEHSLVSNDVEESSRLHCLDRDYLRDLRMSGRYFWDEERLQKLVHDWREFDEAEHRKDRARMKAFAFGTSQSRFGITRPAM